MSDREHAGGTPGTAAGALRLSACKGTVRRRRPAHLGARVVDQLLRLLYRELRMLMLWWRRPRWRARPTEQRVGIVWWRLLLRAPWRHGDVSALGMLLLLLL